MALSDADVDPAPPGGGLDAGWYDEMFDLLWGQHRGIVPTAVDHAYEKIWKRLISGGGQESRRLSDAALAAQLGVSRTPVRQALDRLARDGLVHVDPRRGFWTRTFTVQDIHEIYDLRGALEVLALRLGALRLERAELEAQLDLVRAVRARLDEPPVAIFLQCDLRLHNLLIHTSGNGRLIRMLAGLRSQHGLFQARDTLYPRRIKTALDDHEAILQALIAGQVDAAATLLAAHITHSKAGVLTDLFGVPGAESDLE